MMWYNQTIWEEGYSMTKKEYEGGGKREKKKCGTRVWKRERANETRGSFRYLDDFPKRTYEKHI